jgi:hypothetical protein
MQPGSILVYRGQNPSMEHRWRVVGVHHGGRDSKTGRQTESLVEMESLTHEPGWTGQWEYHPRVFVPWVLVKDLEIVASAETSK